MFSLNGFNILNIFSLGCEVLLCGELLFDEREMLYLLIFFTFYRRLCFCDFIWSPGKLPRLYSGNVITRLSVIFFEKMASCDLHRTVCDFTGILKSLWNEKGKKVRWVTMTILYKMVIKNSNDKGEFRGAILKSNKIKY